MVTKAGVVRLNDAEVDKMRLNRRNPGARREVLISSPRKNEISCLCACGLETRIGKRAMEEALGLIEEGTDTKTVLEGEITNNPRAGDLIFLIDNRNDHSYPLATLFIFGTDNYSRAGVFINNGRLTVGNSLPGDGMYRPTRVHRKLIPNNSLVERIVGLSDIEIFGEEEKIPTERKSSRSQKSKML